MDSIGKKPLDYLECCCEKCARENRIHRGAYRRLPEAVGGLGLCPVLVEMRIKEKESGG